MQFCLFEDDICSNFKPLTLTRPVDDLRTGILTMGEKWKLALNTDKWARCTQTEFTKIYKKNKLDERESCLWLSSRYLPSPELLEQVHNLELRALIKDDDAVVAAKANAETTARWLEEGRPDFSSFTTASSAEFHCVTHLWDLFLMNSHEIAADLKRMNYSSSDQNSVSKQAILENSPQIFIDKGAEVKPGAIIVADTGPVFIGRDATVMAGALIEGPAAICEKAVVKAGAKIHSNTTVGPVCKVGGEVNDSIFHSYSNKGHDGYVGNSLIGKWCNLGAGTNISNLKNNYSAIRFTHWESGEQVETNQQFLGTVMGDHSKTAINTRLNTGTACGVCCNIFSADFPPKYIPSFSWVGANEIQPYKLEKAFETMQAVTARRDVELTEEYKKLMQFIFEDEHQI